MSWSVSVVGKLPAVKAAVEAQFTDPRSVCAEPEETVRQAARAAIAAALQAQREDSVVRVTAGGSMINTYNKETGSWGAPYSNHLEIHIEPLYGFVE